MRRRRDLRNRWNSVHVGIWAQNGPYEDFTAALEKCLRHANLTHSREIATHGARFVHGISVRSALASKTATLAMAAAADPEVVLRYAVNGSAAAQVASLGTTAMGPLRVSPQYLLCRLEGGYDGNAATVGMNMNKLEYVALDKFKLDDL